MKRLPQLLALALVIAPAVIASILNSCHERAEREPPKPVRIGVFAPCTTDTDCHLKFGE